MSRVEDAMTVDEAIACAVERLLAAGMVRRYTSAHGASHYLGWPGRIGVLRISDHERMPGPNSDAPRSIAKLTFDRKSLPSDSDAMTGVIANALGRYLLKAPMKGDVPPCP